MADAEENQPSVSTAEGEANEEEAEQPAEMANVETNETADDFPKDQAGATQVVTNEIDPSQQQMEGNEGDQGTGAKEATGQDTSIGQEEEHTGALDEQKAEGGKEDSFVDVDAMVKDEEDTGKEEEAQDFTDKEQTLTMDNDEGEGITVVEEPEQDVEGRPEAVEEDMAVEVKPEQDEGRPDEADEDTAVEVEPEQDEGRPDEADEDTAVEVEPEQDEGRPDEADEDTAVEVEPEQDVEDRPEAEEEDTAVEIEPEQDEGRSDEAEEDTAVETEPEQDVEGDGADEAQKEAGEDYEQEEIENEGMVADDVQQDEVVDVEASIVAEKEYDQETVEEEKETDDVLIVVTPAPENGAEAEAAADEKGAEDGDENMEKDGEERQDGEQEAQKGDEEEARAESVPPEAQVASEVPQDDGKQDTEATVAADTISREQTEELPAEKTQESADARRGAVVQEKSDVQESAFEAPPSTAEKDVVIPPAPHLPSPERSHTTIQGQMSTSALNIVWSFGLNRNVPVLNLSDGVREAIMYPCAHVGIMYDFKSNKQHTLQAHLNPITCSAVSQDKRWLVTGDVGPDAMVNIWDTYTGIPIQTMFDPNTAGGVLAVALTPDSRYLATLSALPVQTLAIWDWTVDGDIPICSADLKPEYGLQNFIYFDPTDIHHVVTNSATQVLFFHWADNSMNYFAPPLTDSDFNKPVGRYSQSIFQIGIARALTATSIGNLVVWDNNKPLSKVMDVNQSADKKPLKIIKVQEKGINVLTTTDEYIVLGDTAGHVKFFDQGLRLIYWYQDFNTGPCSAISFAYMPDFEPVAKESSRYPSDATKQAKPFIVRNFVVGTAIAVYGNVTTDGTKFKVIHREHDAAVHALAAHPKLPVIAIGSYSGLLKLWNYNTRETVASRMLEKVHIQTIAFDTRGFYIAVGCTNGTIYIVDSVALLDQLAETYRYARDSITHIAFSTNSMYFATADAGNTVTVYKRQRKEGRNPYIWHGRYRSHYKPIRDLLFDVYLDTNEPKLLSLGEDRMLIEYELNNPGKNHVIPKSEDRIEQFALPQCMCMYPPITKEYFLFTANDEYKLKCYNSTTKMCRKTVLGPTYGSPIIKMMVVPTTGDESSDRLLAYITNDKVGLHLLPASGNPHLAMALIAHPSGVSNLASSFDGKYLFTAGGPDYAVHMWEINVPALEAQAKLGGEDLIPFYGLLEGGRDGEMFAELEDLFYYAQLRHQGIDSMATREIGNRVTISEVPFIMRAMGFYPSEQEIEDMLNEIKYDDFVNSGQYQEDIDLGQFIKLYINHRPAFGLAPEKLLWAFKTLAEAPDLGKGAFIERGDLLDILQKNGEHMTEIELAEHLSTLLGFNREGGSCEQEPFDAEEAGNLIAENLPYDINSEMLVNEILGFSLTMDPPAIDDSKDVVKSGAGIY